MADLENGWGQLSQGVSMFFAQRVDVCTTYKAKFSCYRCIYHNIIN